MLTKIPMNKQPKSLSLIAKFTCMINKFNQIEKGARDMVPEFSYTLRKSI
jgi:hypothetical protein